MDADQGLAKVAFQFDGVNPIVVRLSSTTLIEQAFAKNLPPTTIQYLVEDMIGQKSHHVAQANNKSNDILFMFVCYLFEKKKDYSKPNVLSFVAQMDKLVDYSEFHAVHGKTSHMLSFGQLKEKMEKDDEIKRLYSSLIIELFDMIRKEIDDPVFITNIVEPIFQLVQTLDSIGISFVKCILTVDMNSFQQTYQSKCFNFWFRYLCEKASTAVELQEIVNLIEQKNEFYERYHLKFTYNKFIGWAVPCSQALQVICDQWNVHVKKFPGARLIDFGAGTGVFCCLLEQMGIPRDRMVALELPVKTHTACRQFFPLTIADEDTFTFSSTDFVLIAWGYSPNIKHCVDAGVQCIVIQGEDSDGCTFPVDYFESDKEWKVEMHSDICSLVATSESISVNTRYQTSSGSLI